MTDNAIDGYDVSAVDNILYAIFYLLNQANDLYLTTCVTPFLTRYKSKLNRLYFRPKLGKLLNRLPDWCVSDNIVGSDDRKDGTCFLDYLRGMLVVPTLLCLCMQNNATVAGQCQYSRGIRGQLLATFLVCTAYALRHIPTALKRIRSHNPRQETELIGGGNSFDNDNDSTSHPNSNVEQRTKRERSSKHGRCLIPSWNTVTRNKHYHQLLQSLMDALFFIPIWICLLGSISSTQDLYILWDNQAMEHVCIWCHIVTICFVTARQCHLYYTIPPCSIGNVHDELFARRISSAKNLPSTAKQGVNEKDTGALSVEDIREFLQPLSSVGTAFFILPMTRSLGVFFFIISLPLLYTLLYQSVCTSIVANGYTTVSCTIYVSYYNSIRQQKHINANVLQFWYHAKALGGWGSRLVVGVPRSGCADAVLDTCAVSCVDDVLLLDNDDAPDKIDKKFLREWGIDYVALRDDKADVWRKVVDVDVCNDGRCILFGKDGMTRVASIVGMKA